MEEKRWLNPEEEVEFRRLWDKYSDAVEAEEEAVASFYKNELSMLKSMIRDLVREKYVIRIEKEMGLPEDRWYKFRHRDIVDDYGKPVEEMEIPDFKAIYQMQVEQDRKKGEV